MITVGETLGPYIVEALIAQGGMGAVFRARNRVTGQLRALKVVRPDLVKEQDFAERFVREVTIASGVRHPNLVETLEPGIDGDIIYLPMELLIGETLAARLKRVQRFSSAETAAILVPITEAVQALHDKGLVHRDLKPMNIFIAKVDGRDVAKVIDLGTARDLEDEHTRTGLVVGSPYYMAVEQAEGRKDIDGRADQYALGVIAYQMLTGARPYESDDTRSALAKLLRGEPYVPPSRVFPGVTGPVEQVVGRALAHDRNGRFLRVAEFGRAFAAAVGGNAPVAAVAPVPQIRAPQQGFGQKEMILSTATLVAPEGESNPLEAAVQQALAMTSGGSPGQAQGGFASPGAGAGMMMGPGMGPGMAGGGTGASAFGGFAAPPTAAAPPAARGRSMIVVGLFAFAALAILSIAGAWFATRPTITATSISGPTPLGVPPVITPPIVTPPVLPPPVLPPPVVTAPVVAAPVVAAPVVAAPVVAAPVVAAPVVPDVRPPPVAPAPPAIATEAPRHRPTTTHTTTPTTTTTTTTHHRSDPDAPHRPHRPTAPCGAATGIPCLE